MFLFADLSEDDLNAIQAQGRRTVAARGTVLINQGDRYDAVVFVLTGMVALRKVSEGGIVLELGKIRQGEFFGEAALLPDRTSGLEAVAVADCTLLSLRASDLRALVSRHPEIALRMVEVLLLRLARLAELSLDLAATKLGDRLRRTIRDLAQESNQLRDGGLLRPAPTHAELAMMLGTTREVVSRSMVRLNREGSIATGRRLIRIRSALRLDPGLAMTEGAPSSTDRGSASRGR